MIKRMVTMLVMVSLFSFSTAYAYDSEDDDQVAGTVLIAGLAFVTAAILIASHDRHDEYKPAPRHPHDRGYDSRGHGDYRQHDGRHYDEQHRDYRNDDSGRYQGEGPGWRNWK